MVATAALTGALVGVRHRYLVVAVRGNSMQPALADGDRLLVRRASSATYRVGDIVVFRPAVARLAGDPAWRIKRVAAVAGDPAPRCIREMGHIARTVPAGHLAVSGDNYRSETSEQLGYVPIDSILGAALPRRKLSRG